MITRKMMHKTKNTKEISANHLSVASIDSLSFGEAIVPIHGSFFRNAIAMRHAPEITPENTASNSTILTIPPTGYCSAHVIGRLLAGQANADR